MGISIGNVIVISCEKFMMYINKTLSRILTRFLRTNNSKHKLNNLS